MGGLVVVGSYVPKSSRQLAALLQGAVVTPVELPVSEVIAAHRAGDKQRMDSLALQTATRVQQLLTAGDDVVLYTTRGFLEGKLYFTCRLPSYRSACASHHTMHIAYAVHVLSCNKPAGTTYTLCTKLYLSMGGG
jgi:hypothetical protein